MQSLKERYGKELVKGGNLSGSAYETVSDEKLRKVAKRYAGDPEFVKYARRMVVLLDLKEESEPLACVPVQAKRDSVTDVSPGIWVVFRERAISILCICWKAKAIRYLCLLGVLVFVFRPSVSTMLARVSVNFARLTIRRILHFLSILIEGLMDEIIMQIEFTVRDALPMVPEVTQAARGSFQFLSNVFSGILGAAVSLALSHRRLPQAG